MELFAMPREDFDKIFCEMEKNFDKAERRDYVDALATLDNPHYSILLICENGNTLGFITLWDIGEFTFAEHFVIFEEYRNSGYGARALSLLCKRYTNIVLEVEPPITDMKKRRIAFYERAGFVKNEREYIQPSYREGEAGVPLIIMSYPTLLSDFDSAIPKIYNIVYGIGT